MYFFGSLLFSCFIVLSSCALNPMFVDHHGASSKHMTISIEKKGYISFKLSDLLAQKKSLMEAHLKEDAQLIIQIKEENQSIGFTPNGDTNRMHYNIAIDLTLKQGKNDEKKTRISSISSYNTNDDFTTDQTKDHVQKRLLNQLSDQIIRKTICLMD